MATASSPTPISGAPLHRSTAVLAPATGQPGRYPAGLGMSAALLLLISAWGGLAPFVGPSFGYAAAGGASFKWTLARALLSVVPAIAGIVAALLLFGAAGAWRFGSGVNSTSIGGALAFLAGAWFAVGTFAYPWLYGHGYVVLTGASRGLWDVLGVAVGPGILLAMLGGFALGHVAAPSPVIVGAEPAAATVTTAEPIVSVVPNDVP